LGLGEDTNGREEEDWGEGDTGGEESEVEEVGDGTAEEEENEAEDKAEVDTSLEAMRGKVTKIEGQEKLQKYSHWSLVLQTAA
jgi:hypothetical protein